jgi:hypothetical protein
MKWRWFARRREIWLPTLWGWLALLLAGAAALALVAANLHPYLAETKPVGGRILVVEGWMDPEGFDQAIDAFHARGYRQMVTTGGPVQTWPKRRRQNTYADVAAEYLEQHGVDATQVTAVPSPVSARARTYLSAIMVRDWARRSGMELDALDVFSWDVHARRTRLLYQLAFGPNVRVGVYAGRTSDYDIDAWWRESAGAKDVLEQAFGLLWVKCCFWPSRYGDAD